MTNIVLPGQNVKIDTPTGVDPLWYEKLKEITDGINSIAGMIAGGGYQAATYIPVLTSAGGTPPTFTAPVLSGLYVRMGNLCFCNISGGNTAGGTPGAGAQQLSVSLPFPVRSAALPATATFGSFVNAGTQDLVFGALLAGAITAPLFQQNISGSKANQVPLTGADFNNATRAIYWRFYYGVD